MSRWSLALGCLVLAGCEPHPRSPAHDHALEHPEGHNHHEEDHGHGGVSVERITHWSDTLELFAEHPEIEPGKPLTLLLHVTLLKDFSPARADVTLELNGPEKVSVRSTVSSHAGVYAVPITLPKAGAYTGKLALVDGTGAIDGLVVRTKGADDHAHDEHRHEQGHEHAEASEGDEHQAGTIEFLKEQQWGVPFATEFVTNGKLVASIEVSGTVDTPPSGSAEIGAPIAGRVVVPEAGLPSPGTQVRKGQLLVSLSPAPSSPEDAARAGLAVAEAEARVAAATAELERAQRLLSNRAIAARDVESAQRELTVAQEARQAAHAAAAMFSNASAGKGRGSWRVASPIDGTVVVIDVTPGATVAAGQRLFSVVDTRELWIRARVPEQDAARLRTDRDARFRIAGLDGWQDIRITGDAASSRLVTVGRTVDPVSRTVEVIYALTAPDAAMRVGGLVEVSIPSGDELDGVVIPRSAVLDHEGRDVVYVQVDGEHFEQRAVRKGPIAADRVAIVRGLAAGERIVTRSAHLVRLADRPKGEGAGHGHIH
jgi:cobalt-zinc-cadmium efflux system membrane fusion protein